MRLRKRRLSALLVLGVMTLGLLSSWTLYAAVKSQEQAHAASAMDRRVEVIQSAVTAEMLRYVETGGNLAVAVGAQRDLSAANFTALTANLDRFRLPGISGASLVVPAKTSEIPQVQREWRARGNRQLVLDPVEVKYEHLFVVLNHPLDGTPVLTGRDLSQALEPTEAMTESRRFRRVVASATYVLLRDRDLEESQQQQSFVLAAPIIGGIGTPRKGLFQGWLVLGMRGQDFIGETMLQASQDDVAVTLIDNSTPTTARVLVTRVSPGSLVEGTGLERTADINVAGRTWQLQVQPTARFVNSLGPPLSTPAGSAGVLVTLLLAVLVGTLSTSRNRALAKVDCATTALRADIERRELVEEALREREEELRVMALTDSLTGLANRRAFEEVLDQSHARALQHDDGGDVCVLFCDIDHFKTINDTFGHSAGDEVLRQVATRLLAHFRAQDTVARLGGDEFAIVCEDGSGSTEVLLDRLRDVLAVPYTVAGDLIAASVSVGMASPRADETSAQLLERADSTMYAAKSARSVR
jgi:diguanylate cyclase (GGDEF)-like protein